MPPSHDWGAGPSRALRDSHSGGALFVSQVFQVARPVRPKPPTVHLIVLSRMARSLEVDDRIVTRRRKRLLSLVTQLMAALQKEIPHDERP